MAINLLPFPFEKWKIFFFHLVLLDYVHVYAFDKAFDVSHWTSSISQRFYFGWLVFILFTAQRFNCCCCFSSYLQRSFYKLECFYLLQSVQFVSYLLQLDVCLLRCHLIQIHSKLIVRIYLCLFETNKKKHDNYSNEWIQWLCFKDTNENVWITNESISITKHSIQ